MKQLTIFDILADDKPHQADIPYGYTNDTSIVGKEIAFADLKNYIGKQVIESDGTNIKVYKVIRYIEGSDKYYRKARELPENPIGYGDIVNDFIYEIVGIKECMKCYEFAFACDRVALCDSKQRPNEANAWVSEYYCKSSRYGSTPDYPYTFHELEL